MGGDAPYGLLLVDKPAGPTSHDIVDMVRFALRTKQVGHCGTLDPAATGLMVLALGAATKLVEYLSGQSKSYEAEIALGRATTTWDAMGETTDGCEVPASAWEQANEVLGQLVGEHELVPPAYSAVRVEGRRAHAAARAGDELQLSPRPMAVHRVWDRAVEPEASVVRCGLSVSKGTYIRSLAVEVGRRLGVVAHLQGLRRTAAGAASLDDEHCLGGLMALALPPAPNGAPRYRVRPAATKDWSRAQLAAHVRRHLVSPVAYLGFPTVIADPAALWRLGQGQTVAGLAAPQPPGTMVSVMGEGGDPALIIAAVEDDGAARPKRVIRRGGARPGAG